jgi:hypothetical protein
MRSWLPLPADPAMVQAREGLEVLATGCTADERWGLRPDCKLRRAIRPGRERRPSRFPVTRRNDRIQSDSRSSTQQCGASSPLASSLNTIPVTGLGRKVVQPFNPLS